MPGSTICTPVSDDSFVKTSWSTRIVPRYPTIGPSENQRTENGCHINAAEAPNPKKLGRVLPFVLPLMSSLKTGVIAGATEPIS